MRRHFFVASLVFQKNRPRSLLGSQLPIANGFSPKKNQLFFRQLPSSIIIIIIIDD